MRRRRYNYRKRNRPRRLSGRFYLLCAALLGLVLLGVGLSRSSTTTEKIKAIAKSNGLNKLTENKLYYRLKDTVFPEVPSVSESEQEEEPSSLSLAGLPISEEERRMLAAQSRASVKLDREVAAVGSTSDLALQPVSANTVEKRAETVQVIPGTKTKLERLELFISDLLSKSKLAPQQSERLSILISELSAIHSEDPLLITAIAYHESSFREDVVAKDSDKRGLLQVNANRGAYIAKLAKKEWKGAEALLGAEYNLELALGYISFLKKLFKDDLKLTLMAYSFGPRSFLNALKVKADIPDTVYKFASNVQATYKRYQREFDSFTKPVAKQQKAVVKKPVAVEPKAQQLVKVKTVQQPKEQLKTEVAAKPVPDIRARATDKTFALPIKSVDKFQENSSGVKVFESESAVWRHIMRVNAGSNTDHVLLAKLVDQACKDTDIDPLLVIALMKVQSGLNPQFSSDGAKGLFALTEAEARDISRRTKVAWKGSEVLMDQQMAIVHTVSYLKYLKWRHANHLPQIVLSYLWGPGKLARASRDRESVPRSIRGKAQKVFSYYNNWKSGFAPLRSAIL